MYDGVIEQHVQSGATGYLFMNQRLRHDLGGLQFGSEIS